MKRILLTLWVMAVVSLTMSAQTMDGRNFSMDGFAVCEGVAGTAFYHAGGTTGGQGGAVVYANTFAELQAYLQASAPYVILVNHNINTGLTCYVDDYSTGKLCDVQDGSVGVATTYGERIMVASNKSLIGIVDPTTGKAPLFERITFVMQCAHNVIIRNCRFTMVGVPILRSGENKIVALRNGVQAQVGDPDCIGIQADENSASRDAGSHVWVDHCDFFNGGAANKDRYDGLLDCKNNVQWMTFSYNHFYNHDKACLWGKGNSDIYPGCRTISAHHNYFDSIQGSRLPLQRGGHLHYMNNYQRQTQDGWDVRTGAVGYLDACYFKDAKAAVRLRGTEGVININQTPGYDIVYDGCDRILEGYTDVSQSKHAEIYPYSATVNHTDWVPTDTWSGYFVHHHDSTAAVPAICEMYSGAGKVTVWEQTVPAVDWDEVLNAVRNQRAVGGSDGVYLNGQKMIGHEPNPYAPTSLRTTESHAGATKVLRHGSVVIEQGGKKYTVSGAAR